MEEHVSGRHVELRLKRCEVDMESFIAGQRPLLKPVTDKMTDKVKTKALDEIERWEKREKERKARDTDEERARLRKLHWLKCPKCGHDLKQESLEGIEIERCTFCEGFFLDQAEIEELFLKKGQSQRESFMRRLIGI